MTTTDIYQGLNDARNSSRVLRPPGGSSSNIFGSDAVPEYRKSPVGQPGGAGEEDNRAAGVTNPKDTMTSHARLFGGDEGNENSPAAPTSPPDVSEPAGVTSAPKKPAASGEESDTSTGITACRKRIFKNEGRDEEEDEEERKKREEEEEKKKQQQQQEVANVRSIAKAPRGAYNPITGEDYSEQDKPAQQGRIRQPPGGASSGLW